MIILARAVYRTVMVHVAVLVALAKWRRAVKQEFEESPLAHAAEIDWDPDTLRDLPIVRVPDQAEVDPGQSGRHRRGSAA